MLLRGWCVSVRRQLVSWNDMMMRVLHWITAGRNCRNMNKWCHISPESLPSVALFCHRFKALTFGLCKRLTQMLTSTYALFLLTDSTFHSFSLLIYTQTCPRGVAQPALTPSYFAFANFSTWCTLGTKTLSHFISSRGAMRTAFSRLSNASVSRIFNWYSQTDKAAVGFLKNIYIPQKTHTP